MRITERRLKNIIRSVIKESTDTQSHERHKDSAINRFKTDSFVWDRFSRNDFYQMAEGGDAYGVRNEFYSVWSDQDFVDVIIAVDGEYEP
jgi:hypothetical protein